MFSVVLVVLVALGGWWSSFMRSAVDKEQQFAQRSFHLAAYEHASSLLHGQSAPDERFGITNAEGAGPLSAPIGTSGDAVVVDPSVLTALDAVHARRRWMVVGETGLLMGLIAMCVLMLWRLLRAREAANRDVLLLTGQMTHAMKTPLVGLRALLETLQRGRVSDEDLPYLLEMGLEQIEREEHIVQTLLQVQRLQASRVPLRAEVVDLSALLDRLVVHRTGVDLTVSGTAHAVADRGAVWTILENLLDNAQKYGSSSVRLTVGESGGHAHVECSDDGRGFDPKLSGEVFRAFRSVHDDHEDAHGTGLGLYLSRRLARAMRGDLTAHSRGEGQGAAFRLVLPSEG